MMPKSLNRRWWLDVVRQSSRLWKLQQQMSDGDSGQTVRQDKQLKCGWRPQTATTPQVRNWNELVQIWRRHTVRYIVKQQICLNATIQWQCPCNCRTCNDKRSCKTKKLQWKRLSIKCQLYEANAVSHSKCIRNIKLRASKTYIKSWRCWQRRTLIWRRTKITLQLSQIVNLHQSTCFRALHRQIRY